jgi:hypothetical protein
MDPTLQLSLKKLVGKDQQNDRAPVKKTMVSCNGSVRKSGWKLIKIQTNMIGSLCNKYCKILRFLTYPQKVAMIP